MRDLIRKHINGNRSPVSDATNSLTLDITTALKGRKIKCKSGEDILTWTVPKYWRVRAAYIATASDEKVIDFNDSPLHLWTHSISFDGVLSKEELEKHLLFSKEKPDWIPYHYRNGYRYAAAEWGFCISYNRWKAMTDSHYKVHIDADLTESGEMLVGDCHIKGRLEETIFFAAHSCHPSLATDGLTCLAVIVELFKILKLRDNKYSYKSIIGPEYYASAAYLAKAPPEEMSKLKGGIYLDMLGNRQPLAFQSSFYGDSILDKVTENVFKHAFNDYKKFKFRKLWGNDELFYNGPGFLIPTVGVGGLHHPEYHFSADNYDLIDFPQLDESVKLLLKIIDVFESDFIPQLRYKGPLHLSKYNLYIDPKVDKRGYDLLDGIQIMADGNNSCFEIAYALDADYFFVNDFFNKLHRHGLVSRADVNLLTIKG